MTVRIGLLDSGVATAQSGAMLAAKGFTLDEQGRVAERPIIADPTGHGSILAAVILAHAPQARLLNAQAFYGAKPIAPAVVAAALDWLIEVGAQVINLSFGLREDRAALRRACERAAARGTLLVAATPARGGPVYPAGYSGVLRVCGDARCGPGELSLLPDGPAHLGACPHPGEGMAGRVGGASVGAAHVTGLLAAFFAIQPAASREEALAWLESRACFHGRERRTLAPEQ